MQNGELAFDAPWQGRAFGIARSLAEAGLYSWDDFRDCLIAEIRRRDTEAPADAPYAYYDRFLAALETLLVRRGVLSQGDLAQRIQVLRERPEGHDHAHPHDHDEHDH